ncbi:MAG: hypothetical protein JHC23_06565 [Sulfolobus sp.]|nr:hypothetical protein [Sulfolobus sp.]
MTYLIYNYMMNAYIEYLKYLCEKKGECWDLEEFLTYEELAELTLTSSKSLPLISGSR